MSKLRDKPIDATDLREYLSTQDSFDLELFVYRMGRFAGLQLTHGGSYEDPVTKKARQYDVRAFSERENTRIDSAIECKSLNPSYPLLISRIPRSDEESYHQVVHAHDPVPRPSGLAMPITDSNDVLTIGNGRGLYDPAEMVGKSMAQVGRTEQGDIKAEDGEVYSKWAQALASASELVSNAIDAHDRHRVSSFRTLVLPFVVVSDGTLWVADYSDDGKLLGDPRMVDETTVFVGHQYAAPLIPTYTFTHLHFCTRSRIADLFGEIANDGDIWKLAFPTSG